MKKRSRKVLAALATLALALGAIPLAVGAETLSASPPSQAVAGETTPAEQNFALPKIEIETELTPENTVEAGDLPPAEEAPRQPELSPAYDFAEETNLPSPAPVSALPAGENTLDETAQQASGPAEAPQPFLYPNAPDTFSILYELGDGSYRSETSLKAIDSHLYHAGETAQLRSADAAFENRGISGWSLAGRSYAFGEEYTVRPQDAGPGNVITFTAQYESREAPLQLLYQLVDRGTVLASYRQNVQNTPDAVFTALPGTAFLDSGYKVDLWTYDPAQVTVVSGGENDGLRPGGSFQVTGDSVVFTSDIARQQTSLPVWSVVFGAEEGGSLQGELGLSNIKHGTPWYEPHFSIPVPVPAPGYVFAGWTVNVNYLSPNPNLNTTEPITSPVVYTAHFRPENEALTPLTLTALPEEKTYGGEEPALAAKTHDGTLTNSEQSAILELARLRRQPGEDAGQYAIMLENELELEELFPGYDIHFEAAEFTILPAPMVLAAKNLEMKQGETLPRLEAQPLLPLQNGDTQLAYTLHTSANGSLPGEYPIVVLPGENPNYTIETQNGTLYVMQDKLPAAQPSGPSAGEQAPPPDPFPSGSGEAPSAGADTAPENTLPLPAYEEAAATASTSSEQARFIQPLPNEAAQSETAPANGPAASATPAAQQPESAPGLASLDEEEAPLAAPSPASATVSWLWLILPVVLVLLLLLVFLRRRAQALNKESTK